MSMPIRFITSGESHGPGLTAIVEGLPAGLPLNREDLDRDLARRQLGHGRGGRIKIESARADVVSGVRHGATLGSPVTIRIQNRDYANWEERMNPWPVDADVAEVHLPRPGHADLAGVQIGSARAEIPSELGPADFAGVDESPVRCLDTGASDAMVAAIDAARKANE